MRGLEAIGFGLDNFRVVQRAAVTSQPWKSRMRSRRRSKRSFVRFVPVEASAAAAFVAEAFPMAADPRLYNNACPTKRCPLINAREPKGGFGQKRLPLRCGD